MSPTPDFADIVELFDNLYGEQTPGGLDRLLAAEDFAAHMRWLGDRLVGCLVEEARAEGYSWADIGDQLGISRQGAQQRYAPRQSSATINDLIHIGVLDRLTERARTCLRNADQRARDLGHSAVAPPHLLLELLADEDSFAVRALGILDVPVDRLRQLALDADVPSEATAIPREPAVSSALRKCIDASFAQALGLGHNYVGTEHLLLGLVHARQDPLARSLAELGLTLAAARSAVQTAINDFLRSRQ